MTKLFLRWFKRNFSDPQAVVLLMILLGGFLFIYFLSDILAPVFVAIVIAYLLDWLVQSLGNKGVSRNLGVVLVFSGFITIALLLTLGVVPLIWRQLETLVVDAPTMMNKVKTTLDALPQQYPNFVSMEQVNEIYLSVGEKLGGFGELVVSASLSSLLNAAALLVYAILVPLMVFFFLKDKEQIVSWLLRWLPKERYLTNRVWVEVNSQIGNYIRGKVLEIFIVGAASFICFSFFGLRYSLLLGVLVGFSVLIPYIGAAVVTIPVALVGYIQFGMESQFFWLMFWYLVIQAIDGNLLVPYLFSEVVNLHPIAIIIAVLFFGGIWGFWGVFFAIPLATLVKAVISAWDEVKTSDDDEDAVVATL
ncbi:MAG: AI-2E family transporter [Gammaproteobacteria bacterium]|nr:AI-2E family transporter [Gammaproteobacteria bacterium]NVK88267.1 AI-2E family transporter [Gammaproteobacteria bacterium]